MAARAIPFTLFACICICICTSANADRNIETKREIAKLEAKWAQCGKLNGDPYFECLKGAALAAASYYDKNVAYFHKSALARPNWEEAVAKYKAIQDNYIKFRENQCEFEAIMKSGREDPAYVQKARCHFRTALDFVLQFNDLMGL